MLNVVNTTHQSILSNDVLSALGETRNPEGGYSDKVLYSKDLTEPESEGAETDARAEYARQLREWKLKRWRIEVRRTSGTFYKIKKDSLPNGKI